MERKKLSFAKLELQVLTVLAACYYVLNIIFPTDYSLDAVNPNRVYPQVVMALIAAVSLLISASSIRMIWHNRVMRGFLCLLVLAFIYLVYPMRPVENLIYVSRTYMAIIVMFALFALLLRIKDTRCWMRYIYVIYAFQIVFSLSTLLMDKMNFDAASVEMFDSNAGFFLITCIPLSLTIPAKRIRSYIYFALVLACMYSGQRSAALAAVISLPFCLHYLRSSIRKTDVLIFLVLFLALAVPVVGDAIRNISERNQYDLDRGDIGSGRLVFWGIVLMDYISQDLFHIVAGNGTNSVATLLEQTYGLAIGAHNGWLDILYTFGIIGTVIYGTIQFRFLSRNKVISKAVPDMKNMYVILFIIFFVKSVTSHGYFDTDTIPFLTVVAMAEGLYERNCYI